MSERGNSRGQTRIRTGYCLNIHPGTTLASVKSNLETHSHDVKAQVCPDSPLGVGLWLSDTVSRELNCMNAIDPLRAAREFGLWLSDRGFLPFTLNGFPFDDFHQDVVKHSVYLPTWADSRRLEYTIRLAEIHAAMLPGHETCGSVSTLPLGWRIKDGDATNAGFLTSCAAQLRTLAVRLESLERETGKTIRIAIEPEPGCVFDRAIHVADFFKEYLLDGANDDTVLNYIGVCHDVCHSAVMFESQEDAIAAYTNAGIRVNKVQISSAIESEFDNASREKIDAMERQLTAFAEPRYLHQTSIWMDSRLQFHEDLPIALAAQHTKSGTWRVHFHVPIFVEQYNDIGTTQSEIIGLMRAIKKHQPDTTDYEIETYAWNVIPGELQEDTVVRSVARELEWFEELVVGQS